MFATKLSYEKNDNNGTERFFLMRSKKFNVDYRKMALKDSVLFFSETMPPDFFLDTVAKHNMQHQ